jgi:hypothetical protein
MRNKKNFSSWLSSKGVEFIVSEQAPQPPVDVKKQALENQQRQKNGQNANAQGMTLEQRMKVRYGDRFLSKAEGFRSQQLAHYFASNGYIVVFDKEAKPQQLTALNRDYSPTDKVVTLKNNQWSGFIKGIMQLHEMLNGNQPLIFDEIEGFEEPFEGWYDKEKLAGGIRSSQIYISPVPLCRGTILKMYAKDSNIKYIIAELIPENQCFRDRIR